MNKIKTIIRAVALIAVVSASTGCLDNFEDYNRNPNEATDDELERDRIRAHILITLRPKQMAAVVKSLQGMHEVRVLYSISGGHDLIALAVTASVGEMDVLTDRIGAIDGVERTNSSIILSTKFER